MTKTIGPWTQGEIPEDLEYQFTYEDENGDEQVIPLPEGWVAVFVIQKGIAPAEAVAAEVDHEQNKVIFRFSATTLDMATAYRAQFWAMDAVHRLASTDYEWDVEPAVGGIIPDLASP